METINRAATEHVNSICFPKNKDNFRIQIHRTYTKAVKFAQQWISVNNELPPPRHKNGESQDVLAKNEFDEYFIGKYNHSSKCWITANPLCDCIYITHWRYIELE
jgi:hypothetical protein